MGSIKWKLVLLYVILVVFVIVVSGFYIILNVQRNAYQDTFTELEYTSDRIVDTLETASLDEESDIQAIFADVISALMLESVNVDTKNIYLLTSEGDLVYYRDAALNQADLASRAIMDAMAGHSSTKLYVHQINEGEETISVGDYAAAFTIKNTAGERTGYILFIRQTMGEVNATIYNTMIIIITVSLVAILIAGVLAFFLAGTISNPLRRLTRRTQEMAKGNLEAAEIRTISRNNRDELTELESNFAYMGRELSSMLREINNEKNKLSTVFTYMADGLVVYDTQGHMVQSNPAAARLMGDRILYDDFDTIFAPHRIEEYLQAEERTHTALMQVEDSYINAIFVEYKEEEEDAQAAGLIVVLQDTTEQKQVEEMQKEFVANVSHELRTPITTIKSYVETLMDGAKDEPEIEDQFLHVINHESDRMTHLISELLELSRIDSRRIKLNLEPLDLTELIGRSVFEHRILADRNQQTLEFTGDDKPVYILADETRVEQVLRNLITNAIKYSPEKASITLGLRLRAQRVEAFVKDTGMGIEKKEQERIFERFYRVDKARSRSMGGTGLGLAIAREIMDMHHGDIWVESDLGKGSTFWLSFPLLDPNNPSTPPKEWPEENEEASDA